jgi:hypothetical protein
MRTKRPTSERFLEKVEVKPSGCHEWSGCLMPNGYGQFHLNGKTAYAHRVAYEIANGPFPKEAFVMHSCDNRKCVNPAHLSLGTFDLNIADMVDKGRQAHGVKNPHAKLTPDQVRRIRSAVGTHKEIGAQFGVSQPLVTMIRSGRIWKTCL